MITIKRVSLDIPRGRRILAVSDIHGHVHFLKKVLEKAGFCEDDELIIDGDIIEKGPYSLETLRYVMELDKKPNVHVISGNVDSGADWKPRTRADKGTGGIYTNGKETMGRKSFSGFL